MPGPVVDAALPQHLPQPASILLRRARIARVLGIQIDDADVARILTALGMHVEAVAEGWQVTAPSRRFDIAIEEDLIEELARIHGYDRVPTTLPGGASRIAMPSETQLDELSVRRQLVARELQETINYAFVDAALLERWQLTDGVVPLANPLSAELAVMRPRLLPGLVATLGRNVARQVGRVRLFELGKVFSAAGPGDAPVESQQVAAAVCGDALALQWGEPARKVDFHDLKGDLLALAAASGAALEFQPSTQPFGHPGRSADIYRDGVCIGWIGQVHPRLAKSLDIDVDVIAFEPAACAAGEAGAATCWRAVALPLGASRPGLPGARCGELGGAVCKRAHQRRPVAARGAVVRPVCGPRGRARFQESGYGLDFAG